MKNATFSSSLICFCISTVLFLPASTSGQEDSSSPEAKCKQPADNETVSDSYKSTAANQSLHQLFVADQSDRKRFQKRGGWTKENLKDLTSRDTTRIEQVKYLANSGLLKSTDDYYESAMILQHGKSAEDYLLAHILASAAAFRGHKQARWLSAATLDRYLHYTDKAQVFGTQFRTTKVDGERTIWTMDLLNQDLLTDKIRQLYGVPPLSSGFARLSELNGRKYPDR